MMEINWNVNNRDKNINRTQHQQKWDKKVIC